MARNALAPALREALQRATQPDSRRSQSIKDILHGLKELNRKREICLEADEFYRGDVGMVWASEKVRRLLDQQGVEELEDFNYSKIPVDVVANRLQISAVVAAPAEEDEGDDISNATPEGSGAKKASADRANRLIAKLRKDNQLDAEEKRLHHSVSKHGDAYLLVWPVREGDSGRITAVDMRVHGADTVCMVYDPEDQLEISYVIKSWTFEEGDDDDRSQGGNRTVTRVNLYYDDHIERWRTEAGGNPEDKDAWFRLREDIDDEVELEDAAADEFDEETGRDIPNPYGRVPWFHFRNDRPEGYPEHQGAYGPQQMINKLVYGHAATIDYQSFPQRYILKDPAIDDPLQNLDDPDHPDDESEDPETDTGTAGLKAHPSAVWQLWGKSTGEYQAANPDTFLRPFDRYVKSMAELTDTPQHAFSKSSADMPSGEAVRELNGPTNVKVKDRQDRYDPVWQDSYEFALELLGVNGVTVDVRWAPLEVVTDSAGWGVVNQKIAAGVPVEIALTEAGYAPEQVTEWLKDAEGADLGRRVALLNQIGTAVQTLGAGIALGAASKEQVQAVITRVLGLTLEGVEDFALPKGTFVDPLAAINAQKEMQQGQQEHQQGMQRAQLDHATTSQQTSQDHARTMAVEAHDRAKEMFDAGAGPNANGGRK